MSIKPDKSDTIKKKFLKHLEESLGIITTACRKAGIHRDTYYEWHKKDSAFADACDDIMECKGDFVEEMLLNNIREGDTTAIIFYCKTKLKSRGYTTVEKRTPIKLPPISNLNDLDEATSILIEKLANAEIANDDVKPLHDMLIEKRRVVEMMEIEMRMIELENKIKSAG